MTTEERVKACFGHMTNHSIAEVVGIPYKRVISIIYGDKNRVTQKEILAGDEILNTVSRYNKERKSHSLLNLWNSKEYESPNNETLLWKNSGYL